MPATLDLWSAIVISSILVFVASSIIHMCLPWHKGDSRKLPDEDGILEALRAHGIQPGSYMFPCPGSMKDMGTPEMKARFDQGPVGFMTIVQNGPPAIGRSLVQWLVFTVVVGLFVAYVGSLSLQRGAAYGDVFRLTATVAIFGYGVTEVSSAMWKGGSWSVVFKFIVDGIVYGLLTAGSFAWLWPE